MRWAPTGGMSGAICDTTELTAVTIGVSYDPTGATFGTTGINCGAIYATEIIGLRDVSGEICVQIAVISATTVEIFERVSGREEDRLKFEPKERRQQICALPSLGQNLQSTSNTPRCRFQLK